jgi:hypothetical protein
MKLTIHGIKSHTKPTIMELERINIVSGPNGSGKTSVLLGAAFAATGRIPRRGSKPGEYRSFMADGALGAMETGDYSFGHRLEYTEKGARVLPRFKPSGKDALGGSAALEEIERTTGNAGVLALSFREFLAANGPDRQRAMLTALPAFGGKAALQAIHDATVDAVYDFAFPASECDDKREALSVSELPRDFLDGLIQWLGALIEKPEASAEAMLTELHQKSKDAKRIARERLAAVAGVAEVTESMQESASAIPDLEEEEGRLQESLAGFALEDNGVSRADVERDLAEVRADLQSSPPNVQATEDRLKHARAIYQDLLDNEPSDAAKADRRSIEDSIVRIMAQIEMMNEWASQERRTAEQAVAGQCPLLTGVPCSEAKRSGPPAVGRYKALHTKATVAAAALKSARRELEMVDGESVHDLWKSDMLDAKDDAARTQREMNEAERAATIRMGFKRREDALAKQLKAMGPADADAEKGAEVARNRLGQVRAELKSAREALAAIEVAGRISADTTARQAKLWTAAHAGAKSGYHGHIQGLLVPLAGGISEVLTSALGEPIKVRFKFTARAGLDIQIHRESTDWIGLDDLSDGQTCVFLIALSVVLSADDRSAGGNPPRILLIEAAEMDPEMIESACVVLGSEAGKSTDIAILATYHEPQPDDLPGGVAVWRCSETEGVARC